MPIARVQLPDGRIARFDVPEGTTPDQVNDLAGKQFMIKQPPKQETQQNLISQEVAQTPAWKNALIGAGKGLGDIGLGIEQAGAGLRDRVGNAMALLGPIGMVANTLSKQARPAQEIQEDIDTRKMLAKPLLQTKAGLAGNIGGAIAGAAPTMFIPGANTAGGAAAIGAITGALAPVASDESRLQNIALGGLGGAAVPLAIGGAKTLGSALSPLLSSGKQKIVGSLLNRVAPQGTIQNLRAANELVPGSMPTVAQVAQSGGLAGLERMAAQANPEAFTQRAMEQAAARQSAIRSIAQDDLAIQSAKSAREAATSPLYAAAKSKTIPSTEEFQSIINRLPSGVMERAGQLAKMEGVPLTNDAGDITGNTAHYIKMALDDIIGGAGQQGVGGAEKRAMLGVKEALLSHTGKEIPEYAQAMSKYADLSKPINQMQIGQELLNKVAPALSDYGALASETGASYAKALRDVGPLVRKATGMKSADLESIMTPEQIKSINAVAQDLARKANAQNLGRGVGSNTFQNLAMQNIAEQSGMPKLANALLGLPGISRGAKFVYQDVDQQLKDLLAQAMLDPKKAATLMELAQPKPAGLLGNATRGVAQLGATQGLLGAFQ